MKDNTGFRSAFRFPHCAYCFVCPRLAARTPFDTGAVKALVDQALEFWHVPGIAVAIVRGDEVIYLRGHGFRSIDDNAKVTPDTLFPIASCTKSFTTAAMALLVDEGKMSWDDPPRKYVPYFHLSDPLVDDARSHCAI